MKFFEKRDRRGVACNPEQATGLLTGGAGTLFDRNKNRQCIKIFKRIFHYFLINIVLAFVRVSVDQVNIDVIYVDDKNH